MNFIDELKWRGMVHNYTPGIEAHFENNTVTAYIGFDPTAPSLTIGNYVQVMLLKLLQLSGHRPIVLLGGATGRIGDPSGKDQERQLKTYDELDNNLNAFKKQMHALLDFEGPHAARMVNNLDFYKDMNALDFLRDVGKTITVSYMLSKESVQRRLETGISFTEFSYQLLQGYDFQQLYQLYNCTVQLGGSDQWGNMTSGTEFVRRNLDGKAYALTTPLLTKSDGSKFGKSTEGNIWLDAGMTSPYRFYQFWINADDADMPKYRRYFSLKSRAEIEYADGLPPQEQKRLLAEELTARIHGEPALASVLKVTRLLFDNSNDPELLYVITPNEFATIAQEIPGAVLEKQAVHAGVPVLELFAERTGLLSSKSEVRRAIQNNALRINKERIASPDAIVGLDRLIHGRYLMLESGKKNKFLVQVED